jgi:hypothetical protein
VLFRLPDFFVLIVKNEKEGYGRPDEMYLSGVMSVRIFLNRYIISEINKIWPSIDALQSLKNYLYGVFFNNRHEPYRIKMVHKPTGILGVSISA